MARDARTGTDDAAPVAPQPALPFDEVAETPIPYALTARARRTVAPEALPALRVVESPAPAETGTDALDERSDTRPARARALARAGIGVAAIARELDADELIVQAWTGAVPAPALSVPHATPDGSKTSAREFARVRAVAAERAVDSFLHDPALLAGLGLLAGIARVDHHAVTISGEDVALVGVALRWLVEHAGADPRRIRVVLRIAPSAAGDLLRHRWAEGLRLPVEQVVAARRNDTSPPDTVEALARVPGPAVAATFAGWRDAFLAHASGASGTDTDF